MQGLTQPSNYTAIGCYDKDNDIEYSFRGTFDGNNKTISGIRIYMAGISYTDYQGVFGQLGTEGIVKNLTLADSHFTGYRMIGGIVGYAYGKIINCTSLSSVTISSNGYSQSAYGGGIVGYNTNEISNCTSAARITIGDEVRCSYFGGIAGKNESASISNCVSTATITIGNKANCCEYFGGIVGENHGGSISNCISSATISIGSDPKSCTCFGGIVGHSTGGSLTANLAVNVTISGLDRVTNFLGAILGLADNATLQNNYYNSCTVGGATSHIGRQDLDLIENDGAVPGYFITLGKDMTSDARTIGKYIVSKSDVTVTLGFTGSVPTGYVQSFTVTKDGTTPYQTVEVTAGAFTMPANNVTASALRSTGEAVEVSFIGKNGKMQTHAAYALDGYESAETLNKMQAWNFIGKDIRYTHNYGFNNGLSDAHYALNFILCDGATMTLESGQIRPFGDVNIYGQTAGTGTLNASTDEAPITPDGSVNIYGGIVNIKGSNTAIFATQNVTIAGGTLNATANEYGINAWSDIILAGGTVTASSYTTINGTVSIADGWIYSDGTNSSSTFADLDKTKTLTPVGASVAMNADGIMTYASKAALDFTGIDGLKAYIVSDFNGTAGTLTLSSVGAVPAGTGLLLKGTAGATFELPFAANATAPAQNYLVGVTDATTVVPVTTSTNTNFILANGKYGIDWYTLSQAGAIGANKAYLSLPTASLSSPAAGFTWVYDGETTGIRPTPGPSLYGGEWYDLSGRKLDGKPTQKGLYIHNGKKVVVK